MDAYGQQTGSGTDYNGDKGIHHAPLSFLRSGSYSWTDGTRVNRGINGTGWIPHVVSGGIKAYHMGFRVTILRTTTSENKGNGFSIRCVSK